ncbi:MAG: hypothetical protein II839_06550 [Kiritimatiellae bacterium]|nr:hypothetical protein [Kiritimatiellia bacterium]
MKKTATKNLRARAALALSLAALLSAALPARGGTVYRPGLWQASLSGAGNWTADILAAAGVERAPGTMMAEITTSTNNPITGTTCTWGGNNTWGYVGQMYMRAGVTYHFYKFVDDNGNYVVDGTTILKNHTSYNSFAHCSYTPETTGWKDVDLRFGNGGGGAGRSGLFGAGWNTNGVSANQMAGWEHIADRGDCTLLRVPTGESFSGVDPTRMILGSAGLTFPLSHTNLPAGAKLYALTDTVDRGTDLVSAWAGVEDLGSVPSGTGEEYHLFANAVPSGFMRLLVAAPGLSTNSFFEWLGPVDLTSVATDGALTLSATVTVQYDAIDVSVVVPSLGQATSVGLKVELSENATFSPVRETTILTSATSAWHTASAHFPGLVADTPYWVRVTATPDVGNPVVKTYSTTTANPRPIVSASVDTDHVAPDIHLSFFDTGRGNSITRITVQVSSSENTARPYASKVLEVNLDTMPTNVDHIVLTGLPPSQTLYYRFIVRNSYGDETNINVSVASSVGDDNVWSGLSEDIDDPDAYIFDGGLPSSANTLWFTSPAGLSPVIDRNEDMPLLRFTNGQTESPDTEYFKGYHSCGYDLAGKGVLTFNAEKPILHGTKGTNVIENPIRFNRSNSQTVHISAPGSGGRLDLTGELSLPKNVTNTTMYVTGDNGEVHFGGPSPAFMGQLSIETSVTLSLDDPAAMANVKKIYFGGGWGSHTYLKNGTGAPMTFPRCENMVNEMGWSCTRVHYTGAPFIFPVGTLNWAPRSAGDSSMDADLLVKNFKVAKHGSNGDAVCYKNGAGLLAVADTTAWDANSCKHIIALNGGCFWAKTSAGLPPSGEFYVWNNSSYYRTLGLSGDYYPKTDGSSTPRVFQSNTDARWGFTGFGGDRTVCWNADPSLNLTNTTSGNVAVKLTDATSVNVDGNTYDTYYAYPACFVFGNRSEFADGTILFMNPIRYELGQNWDTSTFFESSNHVVAARMRGSLKLGNQDRTWNFSGRNFGGYLALEAENADFTGKINATEKGNLLVNSNLVARSATVQTGSGLGGTGSLSTTDGTTVKNGGALFGGEWDKGGFLTLGGKVTFENGSALRAEVGASNDRVGHVKLAAGSVLKLGSTVYVDVDTDPRVTPVRGMGIKVLDWSDASFDSGAEPTRADFTIRPESNSDIRDLYLFVRDHCLYVTYVSVRIPPATLMILR